MKQNALKVDDSGFLLVFLIRAIQNIFDNLNLSFCNVWFVIINISILPPATTVADEKRPLFFPATAVADEKRPLFFPATAVADEKRPFFFPAKQFAGEKIPLFFPAKQFADEKSPLFFPAKQFADEKTLRFLSKIAFLTLLRRVLALSDRFAVEIDLIVAFYNTIIA